MFVKENPDGKKKKNYFLKEMNILEQYQGIARIELNDKIKSLTNKEALEKEIFQFFDIPFSPIVKYAEEEMDNIV